MTTVTQVSIADDAAAWQNVKAKFPGTTRRVLDLVELGDRVVAAFENGDEQ
ncbi:hypothetical protein [Streptosporangium canum]|uniref:hypothetical protein n=1 Tax=Streptosporangium canum TaxID=324952 RepID=UPI0037976249